MRRILLGGLALFAVLAFGEDGPAQVYRHTDKDGVVHFTETPTDPNFKAESQVDDMLPPAPLINLDFSSTNICSVVGLIGDSWGIEILCDKDIQKNVSIRKNNVPADMVLDKIVSENGLVKIKEGKTIRVTTPERARAYAERKDSQAKLNRFQNLISRIMAEMDNPERSGRSKHLCTSAVGMLKSASLRPPSSNDREFVETIEQAIFNRTVTTKWDPKHISQHDVVSYPEGEAQALLFKARLLMDSRGFRK